MALRIPRFDRSIPLVEDNKTPTTTFQQWWDRAAKTIENSVNNIISILLRLGLVETTADGALTLASSAINPDGTIKTSKVVTDSITTNGVTERYFSQSLSPVSAVPSTSVDVLSLTITKAEDESSIDIDSALRFESTNDITGTIELYRDSTLIDSFYSKLVGDNTSDTNLCVTLPFTDIDALAGTYVYRVAFTQEGSGSTISIAAGSLLRAKEFKR